MAAAATTRDHLLSTVAHTSGWGLQCGHDSQEQTGVARLGSPGRSWQAGL